MTTEHVITVKGIRDGGRDGGAVTIAQLRQFLEEVDKTVADVDKAVATAQGAAAGRLTPKARVSLRGGIKSITVKVPG